MPGLTANAARRLAEEAYIYGFAMVENYKTFYGMCIWKASPQYSGFNVFLHGRKLFDPDYTLIVSPNNDTLYSTTFADLRREPIVVSVPRTGSRYFVIQLVDMGTDNFGYIGTRATGREGGEFVLAGPGFKGAIPTEPFDRVFVCPSQFVALATRTAVDGADDVAGAAGIQDHLLVRPLSAVLGTPAPAETPETEWPVPTPDKYVRSQGLFPCLNFLLQWHTPPRHEAELLKRVAALGIGANLTFDLGAFPRDVQEAVRAGVEEGHAKIEARGNALGTVVEGWEYTPPMGHYGDDYLFRSAVAWKFLYTNDPEEAMYPIANTDADGGALAGAHKYVLRFEAGHLPPVDAFWSVTLYHADSRLMVHNPIGRYSIGDRTRGLTYGDDGSLTIRVQQDSPGAALESNWLPAPPGGFYLIARAYMPKASMLDGRFRFPAIRKA